MHDETMADSDAQNPPHPLFGDRIHVQLRGPMDIDPASKSLEELTIMARSERAPSEDSSVLSSPPSSVKTPSPLAKGGAKAAGATPSPSKSTKKALKTKASPATPEKKAAASGKEPTPASPAFGRKRTPRAATPAAVAAAPAAAAPAAAETPPPAKKPRASTPGRTVKAAAKTAATKIAKPVLTAAQRRRKQQWAAPDVYTSTRSPLAKGKVDLRDMLCHPTAWKGLSGEQRRRLLAVMPARFVRDAGGGDARPDTLALSNSDDFRHDCARYVGNIAMGRHDPEWIRQARNAHDRRAAGEFDGYLRAKFRADFEVDPPEGFPQDGRKPPGEKDVKK